MDNGQRSGTESIEVTELIREVRDKIAHKPKWEAELDDVEIARLWIPRVISEFHRTIGSDGHEVIGRNGVPQASEAGLLDVIAHMIMRDLGRVASKSLLTRVVHIWKVVTVVSDLAPVQTIDERFAEMWARLFVEMPGFVADAKTVVTELTKEGLSPIEIHKWKAWVKAAHGVEARHRKYGNVYIGLNHAPGRAYVGYSYSDLEPERAADREANRKALAEAGARAATKALSPEQAPSTGSPELKGEGPTTATASPLTPEPQPEPVKGEGPVTDAPSSPPTAPHLTLVVTAEPPQFEPERRDTRREAPPAPASPAPEVIADRAEPGPEAAIPAVPEPVPEGDRGSEGRFRPPDLEGPSENPPVEPPVAPEGA